MTLKVDELLIEVDSYIQSYCDNLFIPNEIPYNPEDTFDYRRKLKNEIKKGETIFDRINESLLRNEIIEKFHMIVESTMNEFVVIMNELKEQMLKERGQLSEVNNETLENISQLEKKVLKSLSTGIKDENIRKSMRQIFNTSKEKDITSFNSKSLKEHKMKLDQKKRYDNCKELKDTFTLKQVENLKNGLIYK